jgi:hypothetical protein
VHFSTKNGKYTHKEATSANIMRQRPSIGPQDQPIPMEEHKQPGQIFGIDEQDLDDKEKYGYDQKISPDKYGGGMIDLENTAEDIENLEIPSRASEIKNIESDEHKKQQIK